MNELTVYDRVNDPLVYAERMGAAMAKSGMFGLTNDQGGMVVAMTCLCERITPLEFLRTYHLIQGRPSMRSDAMLAEFRKRGGKHEVIRRDPDGASVRLTSHEGETGTFSLTWEEAQQEDFTQGKNGEIKDNYAYPRKRMQMLWARVISDGVRTLTPEIVAGIYTPEEVQDFEPIVAQPKPAISWTTTSLQAATEKSPPPPFPEDGASANDIQIARIEGLFKELAVPEADIQKALNKRSASSIEQLSSDQADDLIAKLIARSKN